MNKEQPYTDFFSMQEEVPQPQRQKAQVTHANSQTNNPHTTPGILLSLCLPTYNRARCLREQFKRILAISPEDRKSIEIIVSDNCSTDDTPNVVQEYRNQIPFTYLRNQQNLGADRNFLQCLHNARGKYVWLLGDDDFLQTEYLSELLNQLETHDFGLVHIRVKGKDSKKFHVYDSVGEFLCQIAVQITFMSSNIVNASLISQVSLEKYFDTYLLQVPLYLQSAIKFNENLIVNLPVFDSGAETKNNGGYNLFEVFVKNLTSMYENYEENVFSERSLLIIKNHISDFVFPYYLNHILLKKHTNLQLTDAKKYIKKYLGMSRFVMSGIKFCFSPKMIGHWIAKILRPIKIILTFISANIFLLLWPESVAKGWKKYRTTVISRRFKSRVHGAEKCHIQGLDLLNGGKYITVGKKFCSQRGLRLECFCVNGKRPILEIGDNVTFNSRVHIGVINHVKIGNNVLLGSNILITDHSHGKTDVQSLHMPPRERSLFSKGPVTIEDNVWIGENVCILPGVTIGQGAVIGANAVVTHNIPPFSVASGIPAKVKSSNF